MKQFDITGMSCDACRARVEKAISSLDGVTSCSVNLLTAVMGVEGNAENAVIIRAVEAAGYGAHLRSGLSGNNPDPLADRETPVLKRRLLTSLGFLILLMYISMGHKMLGFPLPSFLSRNEFANGCVQLILAALIMTINRKFFISGFRGAIHGAPNMDTLVALGSSASFLWSAFTLFSGGNDGLYFDSAAMILTLITVGKMLEAKSKGKTTNALKALIGLAPETASVIVDGEEKRISVNELKKGDIFVVRPGESIPADGIITEGTTAVNESALTGESIPVDKSVGDGVCAAAINQNGFIRCEVTKSGENTVLAQIIKTVEEASATKAPIAKTADRVSGIFVPAVIGIAVITLIIWLIIGKSFDFALARAVSVLVISCPCALGLATPVAIMVGSGVGAKHGILFKTALSLEESGKIQIAVFDKTGTITKGEPEVNNIYPADGVTQDELLSKACALEAGSEHPLARAVMKEGEKRNIKYTNITDFQALPGNGLTAKANGNELSGGSVKFISGKTAPDKVILEKAEEFSEKGSTPLLFAEGGKLLGIISVADAIKPEAAETIKELKKMNIHSVLLTGDNGRTARSIAEKAGIESVISDVMPNEKAGVIKKLKSLGKVAMTGDGINDAPALTTADTGIAIDAGTDVAIDAADLVLMNSRLTDVPAAIRLSRAVLRNIRENLFWAFFYNIIGIPLAAGCYTALFGFSLNPMFGAAAMSLSSFCVVSNALRLNFFDMFSAKKDKKSGKAVNGDALKKIIGEIISEREKKKMTKTMKIEGMMCPHCEARVKKTLEGLDGVENAHVSHTDGSAVITFSKEISDKILSGAVTEQGYKVIKIL